MRVLEQMWVPTWEIHSFNKGLLPIKLPSWSTHAAARDDEWQPAPDPQRLQCRCAPSTPSNATWPLHVSTKCVSADGCSCRTWALFAKLRLPHVAAAFQPEGVTVTVGFTGGTRGIDATSATPSCGVVCNSNAQIIDYTALVREAGRTPKAHTTVSALPQPNAHARASPCRCCNGY